MNNKYNKLSHQEDLLDNPIFPDTVCLVCGDDYGEIAEECFIAGVCNDCRDVNCLEDLLDKTLN